MVDIRKANLQLEDDFVPSKPVSHMLANIQNSGSTVFSSVDIQHAFFSILLTAGTEDTTAFYADCGSFLSSEGKCLTGKWVFDRAVMGAQPSSAALFKVVNYALVGVPHIVIYCDDLFIHTKDKKTHYKVLELMLHRLKVHGLKISPRKCKFMFSSLPFLG